MTHSMESNVAILLLTTVITWPWIHLALAYHEILTRDDMVCIDRIFRMDEK